jgi:hypothetical protein
MRSALRLIRLPVGALRRLWALWVVELFPPPTRARGALRPAGALRARHGDLATICKITRRRAVRGFRKYFRNPIIYALVILIVWVDCGHAARARWALWLLRPL